MELKYKKTVAFTARFGRSLFLILLFFFSFILHKVYHSRGKSNGFKEKDDNKAKDKDDDDDDDDDKRRNVKISERARLIIYEKA